MDIIKDLETYPPQTICDEFSRCADDADAHAMDLDCTSCDMYLDLVNYEKTLDAMRKCCGTGLYRGKCRNSKAWAEGFLYWLYCDGVPTPYISDRALTGNGHGDVEGGSEVIPETISKFTGRKVRGYELFVGDVLGNYADIQYKGVIKAGSPLAVVVWDADNGCFALDTGEAVCPFSNCFWENLRIIGNIWDNPNLKVGASNE